MNGKKILLLVSELPEKLELGSVYPIERQNEISACKNERVKKEKYYVWELLRRGIEIYCKRDISEFSFSKEKNGRWSSDDICFSLSHADGVCAVAVCCEPVGVDIECVCRYTERIEKSILTERERGELALLCGEDRRLFVMKKWTQKESVFKAFGDSGFSPSAIETGEYKILSERLNFGDRGYFLSLCAEYVENVEKRII